MVCFYHTFVSKYAYVLMACVLMISSGTAHGQSVAIDKDKMSPFTNEYQMLMNGRAVGSARMQLDVRGGNYLFIDHTVVPNFYIYETTIAAMDEETLMPVSLLGTGLMQGQPISIEYEYSENKVTGFSNFPRAPTQPQGRIDVNTDLPANTIDRNATFILSPYLPLQTEEPYRFHWYNGFNDTVKEITMLVVGEETVEVPCGTFEVFKVELKGGQPSQVLYLTKEEPRKLVKIEVIGSPWVYVLENRSGD